MSGIIFENKNGFRWYAPCGCGAMCMRFVSYEEDILKETTESIPVVRSQKEAEDLGWIMTDDPLYSQNEKEVWICPECSED